MVERRLTARFNLFRMLAGNHAADESYRLDQKITRSKNDEENELIPENANSKVLIEYYKNLGRGPL